MFSLREEGSLPLNHFLQEQWGHVELLVPEGKVERHSGLWAEDERGWDILAENVTSLTRAWPQQSSAGA